MFDIPPPSIIASGSKIPIITAINKLSAPAQYSFDLNTPIYTERVRHWLYKYFKEMNLKSLYKIRKDSETRLSILCQEPLLISLPTSAFSRVETFVQDHLLNVDTEAEARNIASIALSSGEITDTDFLAIMDEWRRVMGMEQAPDLSALDSMPEPKDLFDMLDQQADPKQKENQNDN